MLLYVIIVYFGINIQIIWNLLPRKSIFV